MAKEEMHYHKGKGVMIFILGLLVLANAYWSVFSWGMFVGLVLAIGGLVKMLMPKR